MRSQRMLAWGKGRSNMCDNLRDQVVTVLLLLQTAEGHLGAGDVLLGVLEVVELQGSLR